MAEWGGTGGGWVPSCHDALLRAHGLSGPVVALLADPFLVPEGDDASAAPEKTEGLKGTNCHSSSSSELRRNSSSRRLRSFDRNVFITIA